MAIFLLASFSSLDLLMRFARLRSFDLMRLELGSEILSDVDDFSSHRFEFLFIICHCRIDRREILLK